MTEVELSTFKVMLGLLAPAVFGASALRWVLFPTPFIVYLLEEFGVVGALPLCKTPPNNIYRKRSEQCKQACILSAAQALCSFLSQQLQFSVVTIVNREYRRGTEHTRTSFSDISGYKDERGSFIEAVL
jgi:hypothetical protein